MDNDPDFATPHKSRPRNPTPPPPQKAMDCKIQRECRNLINTGTYLLRGQHLDARSRRTFSDLIKILPAIGMRLNE